MDSKAFDTLIRESYRRATRRGVVGVGIGALAASAVETLGFAFDAGAKKRHKKKRSVARAAGR